MFKLQRNRNGTVLFNTMILVLLLVFSGFAFSRWAANEAYQNNFELARKQAYYVAEQGAYAEAIHYIRTRPPSMIDPTTVFNEGEVVDYNGKIIGKYSNVQMKHIGGAGNESNAFYSAFHYDIFSTGTVPINSGNPSDDANSNFPDNISRTIKLRTKLRTYADYMYLTNEELTVNNEIIWFWGLDVLYGRVHSNSQIGIRNDPQFLGPVSTTESSFIYNNASPYFAYAPLFNAPEVKFPDTAEELRSGASSCGNFINDNDGQLWTRLFCTNGAWECYQWPAGTPYDSSMQSSVLPVPISTGDQVGIFVEGDLFLWGTGIRNGMTIGSEGNMYLPDDVIIEGFHEDSRMQIEATNPNILGLISEKDIIILDSFQNGRGNSTGSTEDHANITITAALVALDEQFTFQHQNDIGDSYIWCIGNPGPDERGDIILRGAVTQNRRGYVHRSNCGGTGYGKDYLYDFRLGRKPPPYYMEATDDQGNALFDIVRLEELPPDKNPAAL